MRVLTWIATGERVAGDMYRAQKFKIPRQNPGCDRRDREWANRVRDGDEAAFQALYRTYYEPLCDFVECGIGAGRDAEDVVQGIFMRIWIGRKKWQPESTLRLYLYGAARLEVINAWRNRKTRRRIIESFPRDTVEYFTVQPNTNASPEEEYSLREFRAALAMAISRMPARRRMVFVLARWHGLSYAEIATVMNISKKTVEHQMGHSLRQLREYLSDYRLPSV